MPPTQFHIRTAYFDSDSRLRIILMLRNRSTQTRSHLPAKSPIPQRVEKTRQAKRVTVVNRPAGHRSYRPKRSTVSQSRYVHAPSHHFLSRSFRATLCSQILPDATETHNRKLSFSTKLHLRDLQSRSFKHVCATLSAATVLSDLLSHFSDRFPEVQDAQLVRPFYFFSSPLSIFFTFPRHPLALRKYALCTANAVILSHPNTRPHLPSLPFPALPCPAPFRNSYPPIGTGSNPNPIFPAPSNCSLHASSQRLMPVFCNSGRGWSSVRSSVVLVVFVWMIWTLFQGC